MPRITPYRYYVRRNRNGNPDFPHFRGPVIRCGYRRLLRRLTR